MNVVDVSTNSLVDLEINLNDNDDMAYRTDPADELCRDGGAHGRAAATVNPITVVMADASLIPPTFSGSSGTDADSWLRRFANYCDYRRLEGDDKLPLFRLLLVHAAADWIQSL